MCWASPTSPCRPQNLKQMLQLLSPSFPRGIISQNYSNSVGLSHTAAPDLIFPSLRIPSCFSGSPTSVPSVPLAGPCLAPVLLVSHPAPTFLSLSPVPSCQSCSQSQDVPRMSLSPWIPLRAIPSLALALLPVPSSPHTPSQATLQACISSLSSLFSLCSPVSALTGRFLVLCCPSFPFPNQQS